MARSARVLLCGFAAGIVVALLIGLRSAASQSVGEPRPEASKLESAPDASAGRAPAATSSGESTAGSLDSDIARFVTLLGRLRSNEEAVLPEMREIAERLCKAHDRCDGREILEYYAALPPASREEGQRASAAIDQAWSRIRPRLGDPDWDMEGDEDVEFLRRAAAESESDRDVCTSAMALGFLSYVDLVRPMPMASVKDFDRASWIGSTGDEARRSIAGFRRCGMRLRSLLPMWVSARLELEAGREREAQDQFEACLALARKMRNVEWREQTLDNLVQIAKRAGDLGQIAGHLDELASFRTPDTSWALTREQTILLIEQDYGSAAADFLAEHRPSGAQDLREWQILMGAASLRRGDLDAARDAYARAEPPPWGKDVRRGLALVDIRAGNPERALQQLSAPEFLEDPDPIAKAVVQETRGEALVRLQRYGEAIECLQDCLTIGGGIQTRVSLERSLSGAATSVIGESVGVHAIVLLAECELRTDRSLDAARSIEAWQSRTLRQGSGNAEDLTVQDLLAWSAFAGGGLVTWVVGADSSAVVFVGPDGTSQGAAIARGRRAIEAAVRRLGDAIRADDVPLADRLATEILAGILPEPVGRRVREKREAGERLLLLLHGPLERLPVEFVFRSDRTMPIVLPGLPEPRPGDALSPRDLAHWNVLGNPIDPDGRARLPGARDELSRVAALRGARLTNRGTDGVFAADRLEEGVRLRMGAAFDQQSLIEALSMREPIHIATHLVDACGEGGGRIAGVGLELSGNGSLCARQILDARPKLPLAVLSACETAEGRFIDAEGLHGVARAFLESGTRNLLVTLWPVEDGAARDFAEAFHRALIAGELPADAAASARARLIRLHRPAADWAAFRMIGRD
jgi:tetratricopeptide (TPR) repeat protein